MLWSVAADRLGSTVSSNYCYMPMTLYTPRRVLLCRDSLRWTMMPWCSRQSRQGRSVQRLRQGLSSLYRQYWHFAWRRLCGVHHSEFKPSCSTSDTILFYLAAVGFPAARLPSDMVGLYHTLCCCSCRGPCLFMMYILSSSL